ncbi:GNAT family N-acetyltransferase [Flavobacterium sp. JP2137]|uniref:GNAT family N-acetyltransferase n=1 Tax=Flavobacterium sp. JP2137 TaxID=3414510 RepID=UPI003D2FFFBF
MHNNSDRFNFDNDIVLEDDRVLLRPLVDSDYEYLLPFSIDEPELWLHSPVTAAGAAALRTYMDSALTSRKNQQSYPFIVWDKSKQQYGGSTRYYDIKIDNGSLLLGYTWYGKAFQGTGINKRIKFLMLEYAFEVLNMERVEFRADQSNERSVAAMKSIGCVLEGVLRKETLMPSGRRRDTVVLSILKAEWFATAKQRLASKM